jgi:hypothetical protein
MEHNLHKTVVLHCNPYLAFISPFNGKLSMASWTPNYHALTLVLRVSLQFFLKKIGIN